MRPNRRPDVKYTKLFINNEYLNANSGKTFETTNPATGDVISRVQEAERDDVNKAVNAARQAFKRNSIWRTMDASERGRLLQRLAQFVERDIDYIASLETLDTGKPITEAYREVNNAIKLIRYNAELADKLHGKTIPMDGQNLGFTRLEPIGVVGALLSSNKPFALLSSKLSQALAAGNTLVAKPSENTPLSALYMGSLVVEAGIPAGVVNIVTGFGQNAGAAIASHTDIDKLTFTGNTENGKLVQSSAALSNSKRVSLVLSGNSPLVVFDDANLDLAVTKAQLGAFGNQGQNRSAANLVFVHDNIYDQFIRKAVESAQKRAVGDPFDEKTQQGAQINSHQLDRVLGLIETGKREGARLQYGGNRVGNRGHFIQPTIFSDVNDNMALAQQEIFGPVMSVLRFRTLEEVIERCNNTHYGLAAGVFTQDINRALEFTQGVRAGTVWVNNYLSFAPQMPFGGYKMSGNGQENGSDGIYEYLETKAVAIHLEHKTS